MHNLLRQNGLCVTKVHFPMKVAGAMHVCGSSREKCLAPASKFYDGPDSLMTLSVIIAFLSIMQVWQFQHHGVAFVKQ